MDTSTHAPALELASRWRRFFNLAIDSVFLYIVEVVVSLIAALIVGLLFGLFGLQLSSQGADLTQAWVTTTIVIMLVFLYCFIFEAALQRTPAKFITGTKVVMVDGSKPTAAKIAVRTLIRFVPLEILSSLTGKKEDKRSTWWHDRWSGTRVVRA